MAPIRSQPRKLLANDIARYSDIELDEYLETKGRFIDVEDPENLPEDFIQRLRVRAGASDTIRSLPIDPDDLIARLGNISANRPALLRPPSSTASTIIYSDEEQYGYDLEEEIEWYHKLINEGGRPSHPVSLGRDVIENPGEYREIISYWQSVNSDEENHTWKVFGSQFWEWEAFRKHQRFVRERGRFTKYCQRLQDRLRRHEVGLAFQLDEEPDRQDKLSTWIEFLSYEYEKYDKQAGITEIEQLQHDEAWAKLVDSKVLEPSETEELLWHFTHGFQLDKEEFEARKTVESLTSVIDLAKQAPKLRSTSMDKQNFIQADQTLSLMRSKLAAATTSLESIIRRHRLIVDFKKQTTRYYYAKRNVDRRSKILRWILQQVPLIELERNPSKVFSKNTTGGDSTLQRGLKRNRVDDSSEERVLKRKKEDDEGHVLPESKVPDCAPRGGLSMQFPRQTQSSHTNDPLISSLHSRQALQVPKASITKLDCYKSGLGEIVQVKKDRKRGKIKMGSTPDSRALRRSTRPRRPPDRLH